MYALENANFRFILVFRPFVYHQWIFILGLIILFFQVNFLTFIFIWESLWPFTPVYRQYTVLGSAFCIASCSDSIIYCNQRGESFLTRISSLFLSVITKFFSFFKHTIFWFGGTEQGQTFLTASYKQIPSILAKNSANSSNRKLKSRHYSILN